MTCKEFNRLLDSYLGGNLRPEEQEAFEAHYFHCANCFTALKIVERLSSKNVGIAAGRPAPTIRGWWLNWQPLTAMAALFLVVVLSIWHITAAGHMKHLYNISAVPPPAYMITETRNGLTPEQTEIETTLARAMGFYQQKNYRAALALLNQIPATTTNARITFFQGICFLYTDQLESAVHRMDVIIDATNPSYYDEAIYYKAIALIRRDKKSQAMVLLQNLAEMFSPYAGKAKELLGQRN